MAGFIVSSRYCKRTVVLPAAYQRYSIAATFDSLHHTFEITISAKDSIDNEREYFMEKTRIREQIRYQRNDIAAQFKKKPLWFNRLQPVKILNISKQGIAVCSNQALKPNSRVEIMVSFKEEQRFLLYGWVVHTFDCYRNDPFVELLDGNPPLPLPFKYGIRFERHDLPFWDYLVESGCRNGFEVRQQGFYQRQARF